MRILVVSNLYPPHHQGGYELRCAQVVDDLKGETLVAASSVEPAVKGAFAKDVRGGNLKGAQAIGEVIAKRAIDKGIKRVVFDRSGFLYHGRIRAIADAARKAGLEF